jgi:hypothetical protein
VKRDRRENRIGGYPVLLESPRGLSYPCPHDRRKRCPDRQAEGYGEYPRPRRRIPQGLAGPSISPAYRRPDWIEMVNFWWRNELMSALCHGRPLPNKDEHKTPLEWVPGMSQMWTIFDHSGVPAQSSRRFARPIDGQAGWGSRGISFKLQQFLGAPMEFQKSERCRLCGVS